LSKFCKDKEVSQSGLKCNLLFFGKSISDSRKERRRERVGDTIEVMLGWFKRILLFYTNNTTTTNNNNNNTYNNSNNNIDISAVAYCGSLKMAKLSLLMSRSIHFVFLKQTI
jgi:hypothetical protein